MQTARTISDPCGRLRFPMIACAAAQVIAVLIANDAQAACTPIPDRQIALQLYSVKQSLNPSALPASFAALRKIGFRNIERFGGTLGVPLETYRAAASGNGLAVIGGHGDLEGAGWANALEEAVALRQGYVGSEGFGPPGLDSLVHTLATAANLNALGRAAAGRGLRLYLHNHEAEFTQKYPYDLNRDGTSPLVSAWEIVANATDPGLVSFEIDVHWARRGLGLDRFQDLLALLRKYRGRIALLHVKDTAADGTIADLGQGTTDWPAVFAAAGPDVRYYIWEHDAPADELKSAAAAYRYLRCGK